MQKDKHPAFSWRRLITGKAPEPSDLRRFVNIQPVLDYGALEPGGKATKAIRATIAKLGLTPDKGVRVRLTGSVALSDEEFATVADGAALNGVVTILVVLLILWLALKQARIILAVLINLAVGLTFTAAIGLRMVGALNLISVAFAVLFIGLGVDFGIQFSVRYRAERYAEPRSRRGASERPRAAWRGRFCSPPLDRGRLLFVPADRLCGALRTRTDRRNRHDRRVRDDRDPASGAAFRAQAGRRAGADRLGRARAARPLSRPAAQLGRRRHADRRHSWPAAARELALRLQPDRLTIQACRIGLDPARPDARSRHEPQHHRYPRERSRARLRYGRKAAPAFRKSPRCGRS